MESKSDRVINAARKLSTRLEINGNAVHRRISPHYAECVAVFYGDDANASAKLFLRAPELVQALRDIVKHIDVLSGMPMCQVSGTRRIAMDALAKAGCQTLEEIE